MEYMGEKEATGEVEKVTMTETANTTATDYVTRAETEMGALAAND